MRLPARYWLAYPKSIVLASLLAGCAWKGEGLVERTPLGPYLQASTGQRWKLVYTDEHRALRHLEGQIVTIEGRRVFKNLTVKDFGIPTGEHGMNVWFGTLERRGVQLGLEDQNNGGYYLLDPGVPDALVDAVGGQVLVEGYVDGPHRIRVLHYRVLE